MLPLILLTGREVLLLYELKSYWSHSTLLCNYILFKCHYLMLFAKKNLHCLNNNKKNTPMWISTNSHQKSKLNITDMFSFFRDTIWKTIDQFKKEQSAVLKLIISGDEDCGRRGSWGSLYHLRPTWHRENDDPRWIHQTGLIKKNFKS